MVVNESFNRLTTSKDIHWLSVWQLALSALACIGLILIALLNVLIALWDVFMLGASLQEFGSTLLMASGLLFSAVLVFFSAAHAFSRLTDRPIKFPGGRLLRAPKPGLLMLIFPVLVIAGFIISRIDVLAWLLLPPIHIVVVGTPIYWLISMAIQKLPKFSPQRRWGTFASGLVLGPLLIMVFEFGALFLIVIGLGMIMAYRPDQMDYLISLADRIQRAPQTLENLTRIIAPFLSRPSVIFMLLAFTAVIVPLIEEALKPIGVWLLAGQRISPMEGFIAGCLSGSAYALFENLSFISNLDGWATLVIVRIGTSIMHIATSGLMGWGLALAWKRGQYLKLGLAYVTAVLFHGLWNGLAVLTAVAAITLMADVEQSTLIKMGFTAPLGILLLIVIIFLFIFHSNRRLRNRLNKQSILDSLSE